MNEATTTLTRTAIPAVPTIIRTTVTSVATAIASVTTVSALATIAPMPPTLSVGRRGKHSNQDCHNATKPE